MEITTGSFKIILQNICCRLKSSKDDVSETFTTNLKVLTMLELCRFAVLKLKLTVTDSAANICHCGTAETFPQLLCHFGGMSYLFAVTCTIRSGQNAAYRKDKHVSLWGS